MFAVHFRREWRCAVRSRGEILNPLAFLFLGALLFALAFGGERAALSEFAAGILWTLVLLTNLLSLEALFRRDFENGALEQCLLLARPLFLAVLAKVAVQWCVSGLAMTALAPLAALLLNLRMEAVPVLMLCLLLGSPALSLLGALGAALSLGLGRGGALLALLILPLHLPVLIFGLSATLDGAAGLDATAQIYWLAAFTMLALTLSPFALAAALKIGAEQS